MVWEAIKEDSTRIFIRCPDQMNSDDYEEVPKKELLPMYDTRNIFQQAGAPCHKSRLMTTFLDKAKICVLSDLLSQLQI